MSVFNEYQIRQAIESFQKTHPVSFAYDISHFDSKKNVDTITQYINDLCEKAQKDSEMHIIMEMAKQYMNGARPLYMPRLKGHWIRPSNASKRSYRRMCDQCHGISYFCGPTNYPNCPYCLADMRGDNNDK